MSETAKQKKGLGRAAVLAGGALVIGGGILGVSASQHVPTVRPGVIVAGKDISGKTKQEALTALKAWFSESKAKNLKLVSEYLLVQPQNVTPESLGASLELEATMKEVPFEDFLAFNSRRLTGSVVPVKDIEPTLKFDSKKIEALADFIEENMKAGAPARATWQEGRVTRTHEVPGMSLDLSKLSDAVFRAVLEGKETEIPMELAAKKVADEDLDKITEVVSSYTTHFNNGQSERSNNIRLAASILNGRILLPGETFSFNRFLGRRTSAGGFQRAGVLVNGRKEYDIGGGICQVSTTLYNAAVFADLKIKARSPHSRPVPYVPLGRDAAVSFPEPDLAFTNTHDTPIAISATVGPGVIDFRILGQKSEEKEIQIVQGGTSTASNGVKYVQDDSLGYGVEKVIESGSSRRTMSTYKVTLKDGKEVSREALSTSVYRGSPRIIARNSKAIAPAAKVQAAPGASLISSGGSGTSSSPGTPSPQGQ